jgi:hypothetical protein
MKSMKTRRHHNNSGWKRPSKMKWSKLKVELELVDRIDKAIAQALKFKSK